MARARTNDHPLRIFFRAKVVTTEEGMNRLQDRGLISDNCVNPEDVAPIDVERVLRKFDALWAIPSRKP